MVQDTKEIPKLEVPQEEDPSLLADETDTEENEEVAITSAKLISLDSVKTFLRMI